MCSTKTVQYNINKEILPVYVKLEEEDLKRLFLERSL